MQRLRLIFVLCALLLSSGSFAAGGGYVGGGAISGSGSRMSDESQAAYFYNDGLSKRDKALKYEKKAAQLADGDKRKAKYLKRAQKAYNKAIKQFKAAINYDNRLYQAHASLGFALRKTGALVESEMAYENALNINPNYLQAVEYLAETHLHLEKFDLVKVAYKRLHREHPEYAQQLVRAIRDWLREQNINRDPEIKRFAQWAEQQYYAIN